MAASVSGSTQCNEITEININYTTDDFVTTVTTRTVLKFVKKSKFIRISSFEFAFSSLHFVFELLDRQFVTYI